MCAIIPRRRFFLPTKRFIRKTTTINASIRTANMPKGASGLIEEPREALFGLLSVGGAGQSLNIDRSESVRANSRNYKQMATILRKQSWGSDGMTLVHLSLQFCGVLVPPCADKAKEAVTGEFKSFADSPLERQESRSEVAFL
jgi:hypothetical protein